MEKTDERSRPLVPLKIIWDKDSQSEYAETVMIPMDNGHVIRYRIDVEQPHPSFLLAMETLKRWPKGSYRYRKCRLL